MDSLGQFPESMQVLVIAGEKRESRISSLDDKTKRWKSHVEETYLKTPHEHKTLYVSHSWIMTSREVIGITKEFILNKNASRLINCSMSYSNRFGQTVAGQTILNHLQARF